LPFAPARGSTFTAPVSLPAAASSTACNGLFACIPQPGTTQQLVAIGDRLMYRLAYRRFADGHESLVVNHSVAVNVSSQSPAGNTAVRWYELRNPGGTPAVYQQGSFSPDGTSRWMGS